MNEACDILIRMNTHLTRDDLHLIEQLERLARGCPAAARPTQHDLTHILARQRPASFAALRFDLQAQGVQLHRVTTSTTIQAAILHADIDVVLRAEQPKLAFRIGGPLADAIACGVLHVSIEGSVPLFSLAADAQNGFGDVFSAPGWGALQEDVTELAIASQARLRRFLEQTNVH